MRGIHKTILVLLMLISTILFSTAVTADITPVSFNLESEPVTDKILEDGSAEFIITINNLQDTKDTFKVLPLEDVKWTPQFVPMLDRIKDVDGKSSETIRMFIKPSGVPRGTYNVKVTLESENTNTRYNTILRIAVGPHPSMYDPDVSVLANIPPRMDPNNDYDAKITLTNNNIIDLGTVHVSATSNFVSYEQDITLGPEEEKVVSIAIPLPEDVTPQTDNMRIKVTRGDTVFYEDTHGFEVLEYLPPFEQNMTVKKSFLKTTKTIVLKNTGNKEKTSPVKLETARRLAFFTDTEPSAEIVKEDRKMYYVWDLTIQSGETETITASTSYRGLALLILLAVIGYMIYLIMKAPIVVTKKFRDVIYDEGSISEAKVIMHIKNRTRKPVKHVKIVERLPHVLGVKKGAFKHTLEPTKAYKHGKEGTVLEYELPIVEPKEERLITYEIKSKLHIIGSVTIKPTVVKYRGKSGHTESAASGELTIPGVE